ncbi:FAD/NAD(P)-binding protein [Sphingobium sp. AN558]|uniref:FAD/NAD(P)-binding protein n=1 Tax=Sphingobium sp. AN558 TaxID=3133442 RepID=UPI0030BFD8B1
MRSTDHVVIVGGGFSGTLLAINLLTHGARRVTLIERSADRLAKGLAFGGAQPDHILNVRAGNMSAFPDRPTHFVDWLAQRKAGGDTSFATRETYGHYLQSLLAVARLEADDRLGIVQDQAVDVEFRARDCVLTLASGRRVEGDMVVLAPGNLPPHDLPPFRDLSPPRYIREPWAQDIAAGLATGDSVLLLGSGLTAVDCAQTLEASGFGGRIIALSRRGLMPRSHEAAAPFTPCTDRPGGSCAALVRSLRQRADAIGWRNAVDEIRPFTQDIWRGASPAMRERFLRHLRPYWDVHRHRIAPAVAERIARMTASGKLETLAGKVRKAVPAGDGVMVSWRPRGAAVEQQLRVARVINCTGPLSDLSRTIDPLLGRLAKHGLIRPDAHAIGIDVDGQNRAIARDGTAQDRLLVVGPMTRGAHWEIVAVPDIRRQTWSIARALTSAHWVEAEGL